MLGSPAQPNWHLQRPNLYEKVILFCFDFLFRQTELLDWRNVIIFVGAGLFFKKDEIPMPTSEPIRTKKLRKQMSLKGSKYLFSSIYLSFLFSLQNGPRPLSFFYLHFRIVQSYYITYIFPLLCLFQFNKNWYGLEKILGLAVIFFLQVNQL